MARPALSALLVLLLLSAPAVAQAHCESRALGQTNDGRLRCGVQLPAGTESLVTWDFPLARTPDRGWRRWGTSKLVDTIEQVAADYALRFPIGPRLVVGDLSRRHGGPFGPEFGGVGHASHQNGLDVDIYYPRRDGLELPPLAPSQIDHARAQWLLDRVARGAQFVFIGPHTGLRPPNRRVQYLPSYHDDHMHLRIRP